jgi:hypothetical protein
MRFAEKDSAGVLNAIDTIHRSGNSVISASTAVTAIQTIRTSVIWERVEKE